MPYLNLKVTPGVSDEAKARIISEFTDTLQRVLQKEPHETLIVIEEVPVRSWGLAGLPIEEFRRRAP